MGQVERTIADMIAAAISSGFRPTHMVNTVAMERPDAVALIEVRAAHHDQRHDTASVGSHLVVWSRRLGEVFGPDDWNKEPTLESRHWRRWSGYIDEANTGDDWLIWDREPEAPARAVSDFTRRVLPGILDRASDAGLYADWSARADPFLGSIEQLAYLAVLAQRLGLEQDLDRHRQALRASPDRRARHVRSLLRTLAGAGIEV